MKLTNKLNLPSSIYNAVARDPYSRGDAHISVTGLIGPARKRILEIQHGDQLTEDAADRIWSLMGRITHHILEAHDGEAWTEERLYIERHGWRISGQFDRVLLEQELLQDYKLTSTYSVKEVKPEWEAQANLYAHMLRQHGYTVRRAQIVAILRDYQKSKAMHDMAYPQAPVVVLDLPPLWSPEACETYILRRLEAHSAAQHQLPLCTAEERWERPGVFALVKDGNKRATSLHDTRAEAEAALNVAMSDAKKGTTFRVDERPAEQIRCKDYCPARPVCTFADELLAVRKVDFAA